MTVTTATIGMVSTYVLNTDYTEQEFTFYKGIADEQFAIDDPGLSTNQADLAVAYHICDQIFMKKAGASNKLSQKIGDTYITYAQHTMPNSFKARYNELISQATGGQPYRGVEREDSPTTKDFQLSEQTVPTMDYPDTSLLPRV